MSAVSSLLASRVVATTPGCGCDDDDGGGDHAGQSLAGVRVGESRRLIGFDAGLAAATARRLFDLGFAPGTPVQVVRRAPLGDPCVFRVADTEIALRRQQAKAVRVACVPC